MRQLIYFSHEKAPLSLNHRLELLRKARETNRENDVTGILFYCEGAFLQLLEGSPEKVESTFERIRKDPRHDAITVLIDDKQAAARLFPDWQMDFYHFSLIERVAPAGIVKNSSDEMDVLLAKADPKSPAAALLCAFWAANRDQLHNSISKPQMDAAA
jgi:hypothetical protein